MLTTSPERFFHLAEVKTFNSRRTNTLGNIVSVNAHALIA